MLFRGFQILYQLLFLQRFIAQKRLVYIIPASGMNWQVMQFQKNAEINKNNKTALCFSVENIQYIFKQKRHKNVQSWTKMKYVTRI